MLAASSPRPFACVSGTVTPGCGAGYRGLLRLLSLVLPSTGVALTDVCLWMSDINHLVAGRQDGSMQK